MSEQARSDEAIFGRHWNVAQKIAHCDFRAVLSFCGHSPPIICVGERCWSRCVQVKDPEASDPVIQLLEDDGRPVSHMFFEGEIGGERELLLSELVADGYCSVKEALEPDRHGNSRL
ncbi:MAG TPA: hypothetical protein VMX18_01295 [Candidatus Bipolaricaulota bacterium]|nr:hypothetical protein [Candidatus Bipolaricaulota bacterium]